MGFLTQKQRRQYIADMKRLRDLLSPCPCGSSCITLHVTEYANHPDCSKATEFKNMLSFGCDDCGQTSGEPRDALLFAVADWEKKCRTTMMQ